MKYKELPDVKDFFDTHQSFVIIQADNPDGDSLGSAIALENILGDMGKDVTLYCSVDMPSYLRYIPGWDRVETMLPAKFDASIIVDSSTSSLLENLHSSGEITLLRKKPSMVIDHHDVDHSIDFAKLVVNYPAVATAEIIFELAQSLDLPLNSEANNALTAAILSDSLGLMSEGTSARSVEIIAELMHDGVNLSNLDAARKILMKKSAELTAYKGELLQRIEYAHDGRIAHITIPWSEIAKYSQSYNPSMLVMEEMRMIEGVEIAIAFKVYKDGKVTGKIRCNQGVAIANKLAEQFGGGGHHYAAGFKITDGTPFTTVKKRVLQACAELLGTNNETV